MTWEETLHAQCQTCGEQAQQHRLTKSGIFYCLELNRDGRDRYMAPERKSRYSFDYGLVNLKEIVYTCSVRFLRRSPLAPSMGKTIYGYMHQKVELI